MSGSDRPSGENVPYRVLLADDSGTVRKLLRRLLEPQPEVQVVAEADHGRSAVDLVRQAAAGGQPIEIVLLDVEMPVMDGIAALEKLARVRPAPQTVMLSAHTRRGAVVTVKALARGAYDYVCKPAARSDRSFEHFRKELLDKIRGAGEAFRTRAVTAETAKGSASKTPPVGAEEPNAPEPVGATLSRHGPAPKRTAPSSPVPPPVSRRPGPARPVPRARPRAAGPSAPASSAIRSRTLRPASAPSGKVPQALAIGSSTGGPQAVLRVLRDLGPPEKFPIFLTQHMPPAFTAAFAEQIAHELDLPCREARDGETVEPGRIYVAPGDFHMLVRGGAEQASIVLSKAPPENFCRPAVDPMLRSLAAVYGDRLVAVILTGMGSDGLEGCRRVLEAGGRVVVQDRETSVVWGMPGAVVTAGLPATVLPLGRIGCHLRKLTDGIRI